jgi:rRNA-processing protein FCF1
MKTYYAYLDTNTFLHFRQYDEIDWCKILKSKRVMLVICSAVLRELDKKKFSSASAKGRDRARKIVSKLGKIAGQREQVSIRDKVELRFVASEPDIDWRSEGLSPDISDDRIIATILCEHPDIKDNIILVTEDIGLRLKANSKGIRYFTLPNSLRLKPIPSPKEKELEELRYRLAKLESKMPDLKLNFASEKGLCDFMKINIKKIKPLDANEIEKSLKKIRKDLAYSPPDTHRIPSVDLVLSGHAWPSKEEIERYEREANEYILQYRKYLKDEWNHNELTSRTIEIRLVLTNEGTAPADDIDIFLLFEDGFDILDEENLPDWPEQPKPPTPPQTLRDKLMGLNRLYNLDLIRPPEMPSNLIKKFDSLTGPIIRKKDSYEVSYSVPGLKHNLQIELDPFFLILHETNRSSISFDYAILAANIPEKTEGSLKIIVNSKD